jgi:hypothetical protein
MENEKVKKLNAIQHNQLAVDVLSARLNDAIRHEYRDYLKTSEFRFSKDSLGKIQEMKKHIIETVNRTRREIEAATIAEIEVL